MIQRFRDTFNEVKKYNNNLTSLRPHEMQELVGKINELTSLREEIFKEFNEQVVEMDYLLEEIQREYGELKSQGKLFSNKDISNDIIFENLASLEKLTQFKQTLSQLLGNEKGAHQTNGLVRNGESIAMPSETRCETNTDLLPDSTEHISNPANDGLTNGAAEPANPANSVEPTKPSVHQPEPTDAGYTSIPVMPTDEGEPSVPTALDPKPAPTAVATIEPDPQTTEMKAEINDQPVKKPIRLMFHDLPLSDQVSQTDFTNLVLFEQAWLTEAFNYVQHHSPPSLKKLRNRLIYTNNKKVLARAFRTAIKKYKRQQEEIASETEGQKLSSQAPTETGGEVEREDKQEATNENPEVPPTNEAQPGEEEVEVEAPEPTLPPNENEADNPSPSTTQATEEQQQEPTVVLNLEKVKDTIWNYLLKGEYAKAYWATFNDGSPLPPWVMKAFFYAAQIKENNETRKAAQELYTIVMDHPDPQSELAGAPYHLKETEAELIITSIAAYTALVAPNSFLYNWLAGREQSFSALSSLQKAVYDYALHNQSLFQDMHDLRAAVTVQDLEKQLKTLSLEMKERYEQMQVMRFNYKPATHVFHHFISDGHKIGEILQRIIQNQSNKYKEILEYVSKDMSDAKAITTMIESTYVKLKEVHIRKIEGKAQMKLIERMLELKGQFEEYAIVAQRLEEMKRNADWSNVRVKDFKDTYTSLLANVEEELGRYKEKENSHQDTILVSLVKEVLERINKVLKGKLLTKNNDTQHLPMNVQLTEPLLLLNEFPGDIYEPLPESLPSGDAYQLLTVLEAGKTLKEAFDHHLQQGDFTAAELIMEIPAFATTGDLNMYRDQYSDRLLMKEQTFLLECDKIRYLIEHSTIEHILTESEQSDFEGELLSIEKSTNKQFPKLQRQLHVLEEKIRELRTYRKDSLKNHLIEIAEQIPKLPKEHQQEALQYKARTEERLEKGDIALADEYLAQLERVIEEGPQTEPEDSLDENYFKEFLTSHEQINMILDKKYTISANDLRRAKAANILNMKRVPNSRQKEAEKAFIAYNRLKGKLEQNNDKLIKNDIEILLEYLGLITPNITSMNREESVVSASVMATIGEDKSPLPDFGTTRNGVYDILVLKKRPSADMMGQLIQTNGMAEKSPIVIFLGRMTMRQRKEWASYCRQNNLTALLVDELLIFYLASMRHLRFRALVQCSMPFGYANPYAPFSAGNLPDEMFMGRQDIVKSIMKPNGIAIIYGGRQLGKSAILRKVERDFVKASPSHHVFLEDIRNIGSPQTSQSTNDIWYLLRSWLVRKNLIQKRISDNPQVLREEISKLFDKELDLRILVLLDEADNFLKSDSQQDFEVVYKLKQIMDDTNRRFKVVFSGLHGVQRFTFMSNHPFAHLDTANIRPLEGKAAMELIKKPLSVIGYHIEDNALYRILAYTNYHPALIQHFCRELINHEIATRRYGFKDPLYTIEMASVEAVYRNNEVRKVMYERYEWTVALDEKYEVLVYTMILDQMKERDGYRKQYMYKDILHMAKDWWEEGFKSVNLEQGRSLLDELVGLGVLVKIEEKGMYRIKNANIVRALGTKDEIENRLERFIDKPATKEFIQDSLHRGLGGDGKLWSPLTIAQEGYLLNKKSGLNFIFCSEALGYRQMKQALMELGTANGPERNNHFFELPADHVTLKLIRSYVERQLKKIKDGKVIFYIPASQLFDSPSGIVEILEMLQNNYVHYGYNRDRSIQYWIPFDSKDTIDWCNLPEQKRTELEDKSNATIYCKPWDQEMIRKCIISYKMMDIVPVVKGCYDTTNGWPVIFSDFIENIDPATEGEMDGWDPRPALEDYKQALLKNNPLTDGIRMETGFTHIPFAKEIMEAVSTFSDASEYDIISFLGDEHDAPVEELNASFSALKRLQLLKDEDDVFTVDPVIRKLVTGS